MAASLPAPGQAPQLSLSPRPPLSLGAPAASPRSRKQAAQYLRPPQNGPTLRVTISEASFSKTGRYYLSVGSANGNAEYRTGVSDAEGLHHTFASSFDFVLGDNEFDLELRVKATRLAAPSSRLPDLSPRGIMANLINEAQGNAYDAPAQSSAVEGAGEKVQEIGLNRLTLADLLSTPQRAGSSSKEHRLRLVCPTRGTPVGHVMLSWSLEDRQAEAMEAAERAAELQRQDKAAAEAAEQERVQRAVRERRAAEKAVAKTAAAAQAEAARAAQAAAEAAAQAAAQASAQAAAEDFDRHHLEAKWQDVLNSYSVMLWLPQGTSPQTILLTARQAVGLSDAAAKRASGRVAFVHSGLRVHLTSAVATLLRQKVEAKLLLTSSEIEEDSEEPILVPTACPVSQRASTAAKPDQAAACAAGGDEDGEGAAAGGSSSRVGSGGTRTAPPRPREPAPAHASSTSWLDAALLPLRPSVPPPRVAPHPKTAALLRGIDNRSAAAEQPPPKSHKGLSFRPSLPPRIAPPNLVGDGVGAGVPVS